MNVKVIAVLLAGTIVSVASIATRADNDHDRDSSLPRNATFTTLIVTPLAIEGLTGDSGNLYTTGRAPVTVPCPVWKTSVVSPTLVVVGFIPNPVACNPSGITFDEHGNLYVADAAGTGTVWKLTPNETTTPTATAFATGVPGTNGLAFDRDGNLWTGDGTTGLGRVWRIVAQGGACEPTFAGCKEVFRIQPMRNGAGVGRQADTLQPAGVPPANPQPLVANGLAFTPDGDLYIADTARGAIWKAEFRRHGELKSATGCDKTFTDNTLCLDNVFVAHPYLEGTDGIALDREGNIWNSANERNAIVVVTKKGDVVEVFRNPVNAAGLRNSADPAVGNNHILELPTSPFLLGRKFCTSQSDGDRRDNSPRAAGEVNGGAATPGARGKISCMDQELESPGLRLPVR
jgi:sugar lactone lactonase YvrE